jgi:hypothetical protein
MGIFRGIFKDGRCGKKNSKIIMLSASMNPDDRIQTTKNPNALDFFSKPLTKEIINEIRNKLLGGKSVNEVN